ncbi:xanthine dehydrogenase family protein subunit M [Spiractinospora alimapuensis]|uniref:FAD binding domain-containing protein n=1 Tax=Spiractinospora alimapuensis TaxID=2820884 RepID=UPI001F18F59A|nr:xanthine dehydrogenase family protein subunit M [Spiractinospora alimapuensis]QVQ54514.1 xanthine dehydrogenase family protein subunit M [Spiractinospora alimapuensis]
MKPAAFTYHRARDVDGVTALLTELGDDAKIIAGGQSLVPMMNFRLARPRHLVDVSRLSTLRHVTPDGAGLRIGALTTHHDVETADGLDPGFTILREAMAWVGHLPIRSLGTVGGSLAHADATAEWCLLAVLLNARVTARGPGGSERQIAAADLFLGFYSTTLEPDEFITEVVFPRPAPHAALTEFAERHGDFATVAAAVDLDLDGDTVRGGRVALGGVAPTPVRVDAAEEVLRRGGRVGPQLFTECADAAAEAIDPPSDANGTADYRKALARTLITRACAEASER